MGRVSRYKKIKAIDPFSKASAAPKEETTSKDANRPPSKRETAYIPRKMREMMQFKEKLSGKLGAAQPSGGAAGGPTGAESSKAPNPRYFKHVEPLPGESMKSFSRRVKVEMRKRLTEIKTATPAAEAKRMSEGRKAHLDARAEAKRRRKLGLPADAPLPEAHGGSADAEEPPQVSGGKRKRAADSGGAAAGDAPAGPSAAKRARQAEGDAASSTAAGAGAGAASAAGGGSKGALRLGRTTAGGGARAAEAGRGVDKEDFPTDTVRFGERAERPPDLKVAPRKSKKQRDAEALHAARRAVAFGGEDAYTERAQAVVDAADAADASAREVVRKEALAKAQMERLRAEAMSAYDALKKRRNEAFVAASAAAAASSGSSGAGKAGSRGGSGGSATGTFGGGKAKKAAMAAARRIDSDLLPPPAAGGRMGALKAGPAS